MAKVRVPITDFSAGELSPKLSGRVDLGLYTKGCETLTNFTPLPLGGIGKRGGFEYCVAAPDADGKNRLIPWSINNDVDLMVVLSDGLIKILNVSGGQDPAYVQVDSADLEITDLDSDNSAYAEADIDSVKFAQNMREIVFAHPSYPPFYLRFESIDGDDIQLSYGVYSFVGNIAVTQEVEEEDDVLAEMTGSTIINAFKDFVDQSTPTVTYTSADGLSGQVSISDVEYDITQIVVTRSVTEREFHIYVNDSAWREYTDADTDQLEDDLGLTGTLYIRTSSESKKRWAGIFYAWHRRLKGEGIDVSASLTWPDAFTLISAGMTPGVTYRAAFTKDWILKDGPMYPCVPCYFVAEQVKYSVAITYDVSGTSVTKTITTDNKDSETLTGYIMVSDIDVSINGYTQPSFDMVNRLAPWMVKDKVYPCDGSYQINGRTPVTAVKTMYQEQTDNLAYAYTKPVIELTFADGGESFQLSYDTEEVTGQVGVILTPFLYKTEYPSVVGFYQNRLVLGGSNAEPNVLYMSKVNDFNNFCYFDEIEYIQTSMTAKNTWADQDVPEYETKTSTNQQTGADNAILLQMATDENERVQWLAAKDDLVIGTATSEWVFPAGLTAINPRLVLMSRSGSADLQAKFVGDNIVFVSSSGRKLMAFGEPGIDLTKYAEHIAKSGITSFDFRQDPEQEVFLTTASGELLRLFIGESMPSWMRIATTSGDEIESVAVIPASDEDAVYCVIKRTINGTVRRYVERLMTTDDSAFATRKYLDCSTTFTTTGNSFTIPRFTSSTAYAALLLADGSESYGEVTFNGAGVSTSFTPYDTGVAGAVPTFSSAIVGLKYEAVAKTFRIDASETEGIPKTAGKLHFRVLDSGDFTLIQRDDIETTVEMPSDYPYSGRVVVENDACAFDQAVEITSDLPVSLNIQLIMPSLYIGEGI